MSSQRRGQAAQHYATEFYAKPMPVDGGRLGLQFATMSMVELPGPNVPRQMPIRLNPTPLCAADKARRVET